MKMKSLMNRVNSFLPRSRINAAIEGTVAEDLAILRAIAYVDHGRDARIINRLVAKKAKAKIEREERGREFVLAWSK